MKITFLSLRSRENGCGNLFSKVLKISSRGVYEAKLNGERVADWMYSVCGGINPIEDAPGYEKLLYKPITTDKLDFFEVEFESVHGKIYSKWENIDGKTVYTLKTPVPATAIIDGKTYEIDAGSYKFKSED